MFGSTEFTLFSDNKPLEHFRKTSSLADLFTHWLLQLSEYNFVFKHVKGSSNFLADFFFQGVILQIKILLF